MGLRISPASAALGCFIEGLDVVRAGDADISACREILFEHGVIFLRGQQLGPQKQTDFAERMRTIWVNRFFTPVPNYPKIADLVTEPTQEWVIGENWHADHSYDRTPALGSILYAVEVPPVGGNACFAGMQSAYDVLPADMKERIEGLQALHESMQIFAPSEAIRLEHAQVRADQDYVSLVPGSLEPGLEEVRGFLGFRLAGYKCPKDLIIVPEVRRSAAGKQDLCMGKISRLPGRVMRIA